MPDPLQSILKIADLEVASGVPLARFTTWKVGGPARYMIKAHSDSAVREVLPIIREFRIPLLVLGLGSNMLVSDRGFDGAVMCLVGGLTGLSVVGRGITAGSGALLGAIVGAAARASLAGLEFAWGIPGTVGGAVMMNAGAFGGTTAAVLERVGTLTPDAESRDYDTFDEVYRAALVPAEEIVTSATFRLEEAPAGDIRKRMDEVGERRKGTQPWGQATAGSVFKNPKDLTAGQLLEECGLKGAAVGGARVSEVHANFIVNQGGASAADIKELIELAAGEVKKRFGVELETEVRLVGFEEG